jgi:hypothetical protein
MTRTTRPVAGKTGRPRTARASARLDGLMEDATGEAHDESEQTTGFSTRLEDHLAMPFTTAGLGLEGLVERLDLTDDDRIVAVCARGRFRQRIPIPERPHPYPPPEGSAWVQVSRRWARGR